MLFTIKRLPIKQNTLMVNYNIFVYYKKTCFDNKKYEIINLL